MAYSDNLDTILAGLNGLTEAERMNIGNLIFTETFSAKNIKDTHPTISQVRSGSKIPILLETEDYGGFPFTEGDCTLPACNISSNWSSFTWNLGQIGCEITICMEDFTNDFLAFFNTWKKMNSDDINSAVVQFIIERFQARHLKAEIRVAYFADSDSTDPLINGYDGFFVQMEARATADNLVSISENATSEIITDGETIYDYLKEMYAQASTQPWFKPENMVWRLDRQDVQVLVGWLNTLTNFEGVNCDCINPQAVTQARIFTVDNLRIFGIPVEAMPFRDAMRSIDELYNDDDTPGTFVYVNPNRYILTRRENMILGYEVEETLKRFKVGYDERQDEIYIKGASLFGVGVPQETFILAI